MVTTRSRCFWGFTVASFVIGALHSLLANTTPRCKHPSHDFTMNGIQRALLLKKQVLQNYKAIFLQAVPATYNMYYRVLSKIVLQVYKQRGTRYLYFNGVVPVTGTGARDLEFPERKVHVCTGIIKATLHRPSFQTHSASIPAIPVPGMWYLVPSTSTRVHDTLLNMVPGTWYLVPVLYVGLTFFYFRRSAE